MALVVCSECLKWYSAEKNHCPHCETKRRQQDTVKSIPEAKEKSKQLAFIRSQYKPNNNSQIANS